MTRLITRLVISVSIAGGLIYWLSNQGFDVLPSSAQIGAHISWWAAPAYALLFAAFHLLRAWRWAFLLRPFANVPTGTMMSVAFTGFLAIQMMPLRTGEVVRPYLLDRYTGTSKSALFGTVAIERVVDGLLVSLGLSAALFTISAAEGGPHVWGLRLIPLAIFTAALVLLVAFYRKPEAVRRLLARVLGLFSRRLADFATGVLERFHAGLAALPDRRCFPMFTALSVLYWGINATGFFILARGTGLPLPFAGAVAGMGCLAVGILLPAGPGYFGNFQVAVLAALAMFLPGTAETPEVAVFVFALYVLQTGLTAVAGAVSGLLLWRRGSRRGAAGVEGR